MDRMASIELALMNEQKEAEFYAAEADRSKNPLARAMFRTLARDETEHMNRIKKLHQKLVDDGSWPDAVKIDVAGTDVKDVLNKQVSDHASGEDHNDDDLKALEKAIAFETNGEKFYGELAETCENPMEKTFFKFLSGIEREHRLSLTDTLEYLKNPESWTEKHERIRLDGA